MQDPEPEKWDRIRNTDLKPSHYKECGKQRESFQTSDAKSVLCWGMM